MNKICIKFEHKKKTPPSSAKFHANLLLFKCHKMEKFGDCFICFLVENFREIKLLGC